MDGCGAVRRRQARPGPAFMDLHCHAQRGLACGGAVQRCGQSPWRRGVAAQAERRGGAVYQQSLPSGRGFAGGRALPWVILRKEALIGHVYLLLE